MISTRAALLFLGLPVLAHAQGVQVPPIMDASAIAAASASTGSARAVASASTPAASIPTSQTAPIVPAGMPPPIAMVSPSAPLTAKEQRGATLARRWINRLEMPAPGPDGVVRYLYGATMPTLVCAPLYVCTIELQPGEFVQPPITLGDKVRWQVLPGATGSGPSTTTLVMVKPTDAGLVTNLVITTNKRVYSVVLKSTQQQWMPRMGWNYRDDEDAAWAAYAANTRGMAGMSVSVAASRPLDTDYWLSGDNPPWSPTRVATDGAKTYIEFAPDAMRAEVPTLVGLVDGGLFSADKPQQLNYRQLGNQIIVDQVLTKAALIYGVGSSQTKVVIRRGDKR